jgi:phosphoribosylglycinamide formyltransferase 2
MTVIGTPESATATRLLLLGSGELGKEVAIEAQRLGLMVIAADHYPNAPAMQVAHRSRVLDMTDAAALAALIAEEAPDYVVPEVEAIATEVLIEAEARGVHVVPSARAVQLCMNREGIRRLAAETLGLRSSPYRFVGSLDECKAAVAELGLPCVLKPVMSSSGKGQVVLRDIADLPAAWTTATESGRVKGARIIVEGFIDFDYEITLLTIQHRDGIGFCAPIGHVQVDGDYRESWQPQSMAAVALERAEAMARAVVTALGGHGLFGVEFFVRGQEVWFSEVSPRPHDTGLVTLVSQPRSQFALHVLALLGLPVDPSPLLGASASAALLGIGTGSAMRYSGIEAAYAQPETSLRLFGKPDVGGKRRLGVALARGRDVPEARRRASQAVAAIGIEFL